MSDSDDNPWVVSFDVRGVLIGASASMLLLVGIGAFIGAAPYISLDCDYSDGSVGVTQMADDPSVSLYQLCEERRAAIHPVVYDIKIRFEYLLGLRPAADKISASEQGVVFHP